MVTDCRVLAREVDIKYICNDEEAGRSLFASIKELSTCKYVVTIETELVCRHPLLKRTVKDKETHGILCLTKRGVLMKESKLGLM